MPNYNKVFLMGNLTRDVELRTIPSGQQVAQLGLAINRRYRTKDGEDREETTFVDCEAWGRQAEVIHQYMSKGKPIFIEGRLKLDSWEDKEGKRQSKLRVVVDDFQFLGSREGGPSGGGGRSRSQEQGGQGGQGSDYAPAAPTRTAASGQHQPVAEDDIPF